MNKQKIMVVDDEPDLREILQFNLENAGYEVMTAASAEEALRILPLDCSLILLDVMLGGMSGFKMANVLRTQLHNQIPIIFLTAKDSENDLLTGFSAGGDDFIAKPFSLQEVLARIKALLKRTTACANAQADEKSFLSVDRDRKLIFVEGKEVRLTPKDFGLVDLLVSSPGRIFSRREILDRVWRGENCVLERTVDVHVAHIRKIFGEGALCIQGHHGFGYSYEEGK